MKKLIILFAVALPIFGFSQNAANTPTTTTTTAPPPEQTGSKGGGAKNAGGIMNPNGYRNDVVDNFHLPLRKPIPYVPLREADVMWKRRIWRVIDLREKMNEPLYFPTEELSKRPSFFNIIKRGIQAQEFEVFDPGPAIFDADEEFKIVYPFEQAQKAFVREITINKQDTVTGELVPVTIPDTIAGDDIKQYYLKEDWFFDRQRSILDVRILGIAPVLETKDDKGEFKGYRPLFWLYFPACRNYFAKFECFNPYNDSEWRSFDEIFQKRLFTSYIKEETNVYNRPISKYTNGIGSLLESEKIKKDIFLFEHDMWNF